MGLFGLIKSGAEMRAVFKSGSTEPTIYLALLLLLIAASVQTLTELPTED